MNIQTTDPEIINIHVENCVDLQGKLTSFTEILEEYPDESVISNIYLHCKHQCDSIYKETQFFSDLHDNKLQISDNISGAVSQFITTSPTINRIYSELTDSEFLLLDPTGNPQYRKNNTEVLVESRQSSSDSEPTITQRWKKIPEHTGMEPTLQSKMGIESLSTWFLMFWLDRYRLAHTKVKTALHETYPDSKYYSSFSESVGNLKNVEFRKNSHTTAMTDINSTGDIPYPYNGILNYIMSDSEKRVSLDLSKKTHKIFRSNIIPVIEEPSTSSAPHGSNLVVDTEHYTRMKSILTDIHTTLQTSLDKMYDVLLFMSNNINSLKVPNVVYQKYVEGISVDVDLLKNRVQKISTDITVDGTLRSS